MTRKSRLLNAAKCIGCSKCVKACPADALEMFFTPEEEALLKELEAQGASAEAEEPEAEEEKPAGGAESNIALWKGVWVFIEQFEGHVHEVSWELLSKGRILADDLGVELAAFVLGDNVKHLAQESFGYGADKAYCMESPVLKHYRTAELSAWHG